MVINRRELKFIDFEVLPIVKTKNRDVFGA
jgi:hypothetical protein